mgnify:CR=1 FL=1
MRSFLKPLLVIASLLSPAYSMAQETYDLVILKGRMVDPASNTDATRNIGIKDGKIAIITDKNLTGHNTINAEGMIVSPGFIDMHAHGQTIPAARMQAMDGVTTGLELESGVMPVSVYYDQAGSEGRPIHYGASVNWGNARIATFLNTDPVHGESWFFESFKEPSWQEEVATDEQLARITKLVEEGLDQGGLGVGFLLGYAPGSGRKEYYKISELAAKRGLPTYTHARFLSMIEPNSSFEGMAEIVSVAAGTGVHAHIVHMNSMSLRDIEMIAPLVANAQAKGVKITTEAYPYGAGSTGIGAAMFKGPKWRERIGGVTAHNFDVGGKRLTEEELEYYQTEKPETPSIIHFLDVTNPEDQAFLDQSVLFPNGVIASDGGGWLVDGEFIDKDTWPIPENAWSHPRSAGTFTRFLRVYVREMQSVSLMEAIRRLSYGPAAMLEEAIPQMKQKGRLLVGADADIVVFDMNTVTDKATFEKPAQMSEGMSHVIVSGVQLVKEGVLDTSVLPGKPIRNKQVN